MPGRSTRHILTAAVIALLCSVLASPVPYAHAASSSALKWTQAASGTNEANASWSSVAWSPELGRFVAVGTLAVFPHTTNQRVATSTDGTHWTMVPSASLPTVAGVWRSVTWSPDVGLFVAVACARWTLSTCNTTNDGGRVITSPDGLTWTERSTSDDTAQWASIAWSPTLSLFVAVGSGPSTRVMTSPDGINWTNRTPAEPNTWTSITWVSALGLFVAVASDGSNRVMTSPNGILWTAQAAAEANAWQSIAWSPELGLLVASANGGTHAIMTSSDGGAGWDQQTAPGTTGWTAVAWSPEFNLFAAVTLLATGSKLIATSPDGVTWTQQVAVSTKGWTAITWSPQLHAFVAVARTGDAGAPRIMTGAAVTTTTSPAGNITAQSATLSGNYQDAYPGANVFFRYRIAGSSDPFTETSPQAVTTAGPFTANITGLSKGVTYEYTAVIQWANAVGTETLVAGLETFTAADPPATPAPQGTTLAETGMNMIVFVAGALVLIALSLVAMLRRKVQA